MAFGLPFARQRFHMPNDAMAINVMGNDVDLTRGIHYDPQYFEVRQTNQEIFVTFNKSNIGYPWTTGALGADNYTFGVSQIAENKLNIWNGKFRRWGDKTYTPTVNPAIVTFSGVGNQFICWQWSVNGFTIMPTPLVTRPVEDDGTYIYGVVGQVNWDGNSSFYIVDWEQCGTIAAPIFSTGLGNV